MRCACRPGWCVPVDPRRARWQAIDPAALWGPVRPWFPAVPARLLEVGAGSGRDARWFVDLGYDVHCVEPNRDLWPDAAPWQAASLPELNGVTGQFDLITLCAVLHLVPSRDWPLSFQRLNVLAAEGGRLILSLRRPPIMDLPEIITIAQAAGWRLVHQTRRASVQPGNRAAGVQWDWCVFDRVASG